MVNTGTKIKVTFNSVYERMLPLFEISDDHTCIAYLDLLSDSALVSYFSDNIACGIMRNARQYLDADPHPGDIVLLTAANKGVPLAHGVAGYLYRQILLNEEIIRVAVLRKEKKVFYGNAMEIEKKSITTEGETTETLYLTEEDQEAIKNAKVVYIIDDFYSSGASIQALRDAAAKCGCEVPDENVYVAIWERDPTVEHEDLSITYIETLDIFHVEERVEPLTEIEEDSEPSADAGESAETTEKETPAEEETPAVENTETDSGE